MDAAFIQARIDATKALIVAYETAVTALVDGGVVSYTLDTGQSKQTVTKLDITNLNTALDGMYNRCSTLELRLNGGGSLQSRGAW